MSQQPAIAGPGIVPHAYWVALMTVSPSAPALWSPSPPSPFPLSLDGAYKQGLNGLARVRILTGRGSPLS